MRIIVPFGAGGPADIYARFLGQRLQESLGQSFVIDDRPGAGSIIGTDLVAKSPPDGYTLLMMSNTHTVNETLVSKKPFILMKDFVPVAPVNTDIDAPAPKPMVCSHCGGALKLLRVLRPATQRPSWSSPVAPARPHRARPARSCLLRR